MTDPRDVHVADQAAARARDIAYQTMVYWETLAEMPEALRQDLTETFNAYIMAERFGIAPDVTISLEVDE